MARARPGVGWVRGRRGSFAEGYRLTPRRASVNPGFLFWSTALGLFLMSTIRSLYHSACLAAEGLRQRWHRWQACTAAGLSDAAVHWPSTVLAQVPIRFGVSGAVVLEENVCLGYRPAPRIGSGEILLQTRGQGKIRIGRGTAMSNNISIIATESIEIGEKCLIGDLVTIMDSDFHRLDPAERWQGSDPAGPVRLGRNVWLGSRVLVLKGVSIGDNTVVAAGAVVSKSLPPNVLAAGVPARVIRELKGVAS